MKFCKLQYLVLFSVMLTGILLSGPSNASAMPFAPHWQSDAKQSEAPERWWSEETQKRLTAAEENRDSLVMALTQIENQFRKGMEFLVLHMSQRDLRSVSAELLLNNVREAYRMQAETPWGKQVPEDIFLNDVLPFTNVDEPREDWRQKMKSISWPIVKDCKTAAEAAQKLNEQLFSTIKVKYSTKRKRANQSPSESMSQGLASCTGLSILLVDACRSVGVPARLAGIPSWTNKRGNHTWVEVWDQEWYFTGAAEPSDKGLNHTWFQSDAALAKKASRLNAIYAVSFKPTDTTFPLVWGNDTANPVYAVNVTDRYTPQKTANAIPEDKTQIMVRVWNQDKTKRIVASLKITGVANDKNEYTDQSRGSSADMNDMATFLLEKNERYNMEVSTDEYEGSYQLVTGNEPTRLMELILNPEDSKSDEPAETGKDLVNGLTPEEAKSVRVNAERYFETDADKRDDLDLPDELNELLLSKPDAVREQVWSTFLKSPASQTRKADFDQNQVTFEKHLSPYTIKNVGKRPKDGWPLFIAMHGGGGAPQKLNDSQWRHMQIYYKDQAEVTGYKYLALRAPNNTWNGFYDNYVYPLIENLVQQMIVHGDVDPNKVFIMGYSHGGYGAFAIGPKIPFRFAAVHASAAAPTDGETTAKTLRNTRFTFMVGERDTAFGRAKRCQKFAAQVAELQKESPGEYPVEFLYKEGFGHGGLPDRDMIKSMYEFERNVAPKHLTWEQTDAVVDRFFWLTCKQPRKKSMIDASINQNTITVKTTDCSQFSVWLDKRLIDPTKRISVAIDDAETAKLDYKPQFKWLCQSMQTSGDPNLAFDFKFNINIETDED